MKRKPSPRLQAIQTSRHFRLTHNRHTLQLTPHRTTSYPILIMIMLCVGVFLVSWTQMVTADEGSYTVNVRVPGPAPTVAATIGAPADGAVFTTQPIDVGGICPLDTYVTLYRNGAFSGVGLCQADGTWQVSSGLFVGSNQLQARVFSTTDVSGPLSNTVTVTYQPPVPPLNPSGSGGTEPKPTGPAQRDSIGARAAAPLVFKTAFIYSGHYTGEPASFQMALEGGTAPYAISVDWGDGKRNLLSRSRDGSFTLEHTYQKAGDYRGSYVIKLSAVDADGNEAYLQLITVVNDPPVSGAVARTSRPPASASSNNQLTAAMNYIWPGYSIVMLMLLSFWLGERREYNLLKPKPRRARHA